MVFLRMAAATVFPVLLSGLFTFLKKRTRFSAWNENLQQLLIGLAFGGFAILSTEYGVPIGSGVVMNVRDSAPLCAGMIFGWPAGFISGLIGGLHRWLCVYWGGGTVTRVACSSATFLAGVFSGMMRRQLFENKKPGVLSAFGIGCTMEVLHMLLVLATNLEDVSYAFTFVQACAFPMILCNGIAVSGAVLVSGLRDAQEKLDVKNRHISNDFAFWLLVCVLIAFFITGGFTQQIVYRITTADAVLYRNVTLYLVLFMEVLIYTALFILIYQLLKKKVVWNLQKVNEGLNAITNGNLDTVIDVRAFREFSELSDDVNATVSTLKRYIHEAEQRIDQELEFARQIQHSALPRADHPYQNRPEFSLFASMNAAKEVGGDFYDFYLITPYQLVFLIADVSGKGIPAAMFMMQSKTLIRDQMESGHTVSDAFTEANRRLCEGNDAGMFLTAWMGMLDLRTGELQYVNAGHNPPLLRRAGGTFAYLRTKPNFILAGMDMTRYRTQTLTLQPGDAIFLYTDGVTEAADKDNRLFGETRLEQTLAQVRSSEKPKAVCGTVEQAVQGFVADAPQSDDITMLCVKLNAWMDKTAFTVRPDEDSFGVLEQFLDDRMKMASLPEKVCHRVQVSSDEIWSNIVHYSGASEAGVQLRRDGNVLLLDYWDNGAPFDPTAAEEPDTTLPAQERQIGGLGLHMVRKLTVSMEYSHQQERNCLTLGFAL